MALNVKYLVVALSLSLTCGGNDASDDRVTLEEEKEDGKWKVFPHHERMSSRASLSNIDKEEMVPSFEQPMLMDTISSIRKDMKEQSRRLS